MVRTTGYLSFIVYSRGSRQISKLNFVAGLKSVLGLSVPWANADALWDRIVRY